MPYYYYYFLNEKNREVTEKHKRRAFRPQGITWKRILQTSEWIANEARLEREDFEKFFMLDLEKKGKEKRKNK